MEKRVLAFYAEGDGCGQCLLKAAAQCYGFSEENLLLQGFLPVNGGYGIGGLCAVFFACMLVLGILLDELRAKACRMEFLLMMQERFGALHCPALSQKDCVQVLSAAASALEQLLAREGVHTKE